MRSFFGAALFLIPLLAFASEPVSVGEGRYMLSARSHTPWATTSKIVAELMEDAQAFCQEQGGKDAVLVSTGGEEGIIGRAATGSIQFRCGSGESNKQATIDNLDVLAKLKSLLDSGAITQDEFDTQKRKLLGE